MTTTGKPTIDELRKALQAIHQYAIGESTTSYMSIPAQPDRDADLLLSAALDELEQLRAAGSAKPLPVVLTCPSCGERHIDEGDFATKPHHTHACQFCGICWRPALVATVGVRFLPGFKNDPAEDETVTAPGR